MNGIARLKVPPGVGLHYLFWIKQKVGAHTLAQTTLTPDRYGQRHIGLSRRDRVIAPKPDQRLRAGLSGVSHMKIRFQAEEMAIPGVPETRVPADTY